MRTVVRRRRGAALAALLLGPASAASAGPGTALGRALAADEGGAAAAPAAAASPAPVADPSLGAWAGAARAIDLPTLLELAVRQAPALAAARLDVAVAEAAMEEATGLDDWRFAASLTGSSASRTIAGVQIGRQTDVGLSADLIRGLPSGGTFALHGETNFTDTSMSAHSWTDTVTASLTHPLLRGRGRDVARVAQVRAKLSRDGAVLARQAAAIGVVQEIVAAYWELIYAERDLAIGRGSLELARERLRLTEAGIRGGKVAPSEALAVEQIIATRQEQLLGSELAILDRSIALRRAARLEVGPGQLALSSQLVPTDVGQAPALADVMERSLAFSPELARLEVAGQNATIEVALTEDGLLPQLDAALTLGPSGTGSFGGAAKNMVLADSFFVAGSLTLEHDLGQRGPRARARSARLAREQVRVSADDVRALIGETVARALAQVELARQRLGLSRRAIELAERNIAVEQSRFDLGRATSFDILQRQDELRAAQLREARAQIDGRQAELTILALTGELLPQYGITLD